MPHNVRDIAYSGVKWQYVMLCSADYAWARRVIHSVAIFWVYRHVGSCILIQTFRAGWITRPAKRYIKY